MENPHQRQKLADVLNKGKMNAIPTYKLQVYYNVTERDLRAMIQRERRNGLPILSSKNPKNSGLYLPEDESEKEEYLQRVLSEIKTDIETYQSVKYGEKKPLDSEVNAMLEAL